MTSLLLKIILTFLFYISIPLVFVIYVLILLFRFTISKILTHFDPSLGKIVTARSSASATDQIYSEPKVSLVSVSTYEGVIDLATLLRECESRVVFARNSKGILLRPELRQYVTRRCGFSFWKDDPTFRIERHVKLYDGRFAKEYAAADVVTPAMVIRASEDFLNNGFDPKTSPWEMHVFQNYRDSPESPVSTALVLRIHHVLGDGFSILNLIKDFMNEIEYPSKSTQRTTILSQVKLLAEILFISPFQFITETLDSIDAPTWKVDEAKLRNTMNFGVSPMIPLDKIKEASRITKSTFTTVILECFTGSVRRFMTEAGYAIPNQIHCITPLPMHGHPGRKMRNHMTGCFTTLPVGEDNRIKRLRQIDQDLLRLKRSSYPLTLFLIGGLIGGLFRQMIRPFTANYSTSALMSNFPGPATDMYFNQHKLLSTYFCGGLFRGTCAMGFSALSCSGNIRFVFGMDEGLVARDQLDASLIVDYFLDELELLKKEGVSSSNFDHTIAIQIDS